MAKLPEEVLKAWKDRNCPPTLTTVNAKGIPNSVYVANVTLLDDESIGIADGAFSKTRENILSQSAGTFLFLTEEAAYQIKGHFEYHKEGAVMEAAKDWADFSFPVHAIAVLKVDAVYNGAEQLA